MCLCCCCCNCCNSFSSICIEFSILIISVCSFVFSILNISMIKWTHLKTASFVMLILLVIFSTIITMSSVCIIIYRFRKVINKKRNSMGVCLARISLFLTIISFFMVIISESMVQSNLSETDHPCKSYNYNSQTENADVIYFRNIRLLFSDDFCKDKSKDYDAKICSNVEYTMSYLSSTVLEFCFLFLIFLWFNDLRRIKERVDGALALYGGGGGGEYYSKHRNKKNNNYKDKEEQQINEAESNSNSNSMNRCFNQNNSSRPQVVLVKNNNHKARLSQQINLNFVKKSKQNFIRNMRQEIQNAIESIDEEDSSENKEREKESNSEYSNNKNDERKDNNVKVSIYNNKKGENNIYKKAYEKNNNQNHYNMKHNLNENNIFDKDNISNSHDGGDKDNTVDMQEDIYSNK